MESYQTRNITLEEIYGKLMNVKVFNDEVLKKHNNETYVKTIY